MISDTLRHIGKLNYTLLSNFIGIFVIALSAPLITFYYTSDQMGEYAIFVSIISLLSYISTAALDQIILSTPSTEEKKLPYFLGTFLLLNGLLMTLLYFSISLIDSLFDPSPYYYFIPATATLSGFLTLLQSYFVKLKEMKLFFYSNIISQTTRILFFILFGLIGNIQGLILSEILSRLIPVALFIYPLINKIFKKRGMSSFTDGFRNGFSIISANKEVIGKFVPSQLIESIQASLPLYFIGAIFGLESAGIYGLAQRLITVPIFLLSRGLSDVLLREATELFTKKIQDFYLYIRNMHVLLLGVSSIICFIFFLITKPYLEILLPSHWLGIIPILPPMSLVIINRISMNPFFAITIPLNKNIYKLWYEIIGILLIIAIGAICYFDNLSFYNCIFMTSIINLTLSSIFFYLIFGPYFIRLNKNTQPI